MKYGRPKRPRKRPKISWPQPPVIIHQKENFEMQAASRGKPKISRVIHWRSENGKQCVVSGPFPDGLFRSDTRNTVKGASKAGPDSMYVHGETSREDQYAKVLVQDVIEILSGENEFGEVSP